MRYSFLLQGFLFSGNLVFLCAAVDLTFGSLIEDQLHTHTTRHGIKDDLWYVPDPFDLCHRSHLIKISFSILFLAWKTRLEKHPNTNREDANKSFLEECRKTFSDHPLSFMIKSAESTAMLEEMIAETADLIHADDDLPLPELLESAMRNQLSMAGATTTTTGEGILNQSINRSFI